MFILYPLLLSAAIAIWRGANVRRLADLRVRHVWLLFIPLALQLLAFSALGDQPFLGAPLARLVYPASMLIAALALALNRHLPGAFWIGLGLVSNAAVILLNGGFMPVSAEARGFAGMPPLAGREMNVVPLTGDSRLPWLADILPLPSLLPFANVLSIGDLLISLGAFIFIQRALVPRAVTPAD